VKWGVEGDGHGTVQRLWLDVSSCGSQTRTRDPGGGTGTRRGRKNQPVEPYLSLVRSGREQQKRRRRRGESGRRVGANLPGEVAQETGESLLPSSPAWGMVSPLRYVRWLATQVSMRPATFDLFEFGQNQFITVYLTLLKDTGSGKL
jgi:hypothetical protein